MGPKRDAAAGWQAVVLFDIPGTSAPSAADGMRCDIGNVWRAHGRGYK